MLSTRDNPTLLDFEAIATKLLFSELRFECTNLLQASTQISNGIS